MSLLFGFIFSSLSVAWAQPDELVFGVLRDGDTPSEDVRVQELIQSIQDLGSVLGPEVEIRIPIEYTQPPRIVEGSDIQIEQRKKLETLLAAKDIDFIIASGPIGAKVVSEYGQSRMGLSKPVFAPIVYESTIQRLTTEMQKNKSGIKNFHFIDIPFSFENDLSAFSEIIPFSQLAVVVDEKVAASLGKTLKEEIMRRFPSIQKLEILPVGSSASPLIAQLASLPDTIQAIYITETYSMSDKERGVLINNLNNLKKPTFSRIGIKDVQKGVFSGLMHQDTNKLRLSFFQDSLVRHYLDKVPLEKLPVFLNVYGNLMINVRTSASIGVALSWDVLAEAMQISGKTGYGRFGVTEASEELGLSSVLSVPKDHPLLRAENDKVMLLEYEVGKASSYGLPQIDLAVGGVLRDQDRADQSLNLLPSYNLNTNIQVHQTLFSPSERRDVRLAQEKLQLSKGDVDQKREALRAVFAQHYIQLCAASAEENAYRELLGRIRNIYDIAKRRSYSDPSLRGDVLHLEAQLQQYKRRVLDAQANTRQMEILLNKVMWRQLELSVQLSEQDVRIEVPKKEQLLMSYMSEPQSFPIFSKVILQRGKKNNYELQLRKTAQNFKKTELEEVKNSQFDPTIGVYGSAQWNFLQPYDTRLDRDPLLGIITQRDNLDWTAGVYLNIPVFDGFYKKNELSQKYAEVANENHRFNQAERDLEATLRKRLIELNTKYRSIAFNKKSEETSKLGFEELLRQYEGGSVPLSAVTSVHAMANESYFSHIHSLFSFRLEFVSLLGELGLLDYYSEQKVSEELFNELDEVYRQNGFSIPSKVR